MFNIDSIIAFIFNLYFDVRDSLETGNNSLDSSTITLVCVADNSLPEATIRDYCKNVEVYYGYLIKSLLSVTSRTRFNDTAKSIFRSLPLLTPYDMVDFNHKMDSFSSIKENIFNKGTSSSLAVSTFAEEAMRQLVEKELRNNQLLDSFSMEANDVMVQESRGGAPVYVNADITVNAFGKTIEKKLTIGVRVIPKPVDKEWLMSFFIKKGKVNVQAPKDSFFSKIKAKLSFNKGRAKDLKLDGPTKKDLVTIFDNVSKVNKPFVNILMNSTTASALEAANMKVLSPDVLKKIYGTYPVSGVGIINTMLDKITVSLTRDTTYKTLTMAEFQSEVSTLEKELQEIVRTNARF